MSARREQVVLADGYGDWSPITVHLHGGISIRDRSDPYKGAMFAVYPGDVVFSKIDARSGAIGILPDAIAKAVVTPEFPVFVPDPQKLDGRFVQRVLRTGGFLKALRAKATGTSGRKRITPEAFLALRIPLPTLAEQQEMVEAYQAAIAQAAELESEAAKVESEAIAHFEAALGFTESVPLPDRPIFVASFKDLDRWSHEAVLRHLIGGAQLATAPFPIVELRDAIHDLENGWSPKCLDRPAKDDEWGVLKVSAASSGVYRAERNKALPDDLVPRSRLAARVGDVLITRASGDAHFVGVAAFVDQTRERLMICDKIFRVLFRTPSPILPEFVADVLGIRHVRGQIERQFSTKSAMMKNISKPALLSLAFPLPPLDVQSLMTGALKEARAKAAALRRDAEDLITRAAGDFERVIYAAEASPENAEATPQAEAEIEAEAA